MNDTPKKTKLVTLPGSLLKALYALQQEPTDYEWGGGIDFEIIAGIPQVERVLTYFGEEAQVPSRVARKYSGDVEVIFHTHPRQSLVQPSPGDILSFVWSPAQISLIIAGEQIGFLEKRPDHNVLMEKAESMFVPTYYNPEKAIPELKQALDDVGIDFILYTRGEDSPVFDLEVVRRIMTKGHVK